MLEESTGEIQASWSRHSISAVVGNDAACYGAEDSGDYEGSGCITGGMMGVLRIMTGNIRMTLLAIVLIEKRTW